MKHVFFLWIALGLLAPLAGSAQVMPTTVTNADIAKEAAIERAMLTVIGQLQNNFEKYKGDLLQKNADGSTYYAVKDLDIGTPSQYIMVNPQGISVYIAVFSESKSDALLPFLGSAAFKGLNNSEAGLFVKEVDTGTANGMLKYMLTFEGLHPASFMFDVVKIQGTLVVGNQ